RLTRLTFDSGTDRDPEWTRDGRRIIFTGRAPTRLSSISTPLSQRRSCWNRGRNSQKNACYTPLVGARRVVGAVIVLICLGAPIVEVFDRWDHTAQDGNETEANVVVAALCVGLALSVAQTIAARMRPVSACCDVPSMSSTDSFAVSGRQRRPSPSPTG